MNARQQRLETLFQAALEQDTPEARASVLTARCPDDPALRQEVEGLLVAAEAAERVFQPHESDRARFPESDPESPSKALGAHIGRYKLLEKIGEGGMGTVYLAEQREPVVRKVALKIIKLGMDTKAVVARFEAERQALALMDHPHIAKVLDGGLTEEGRPYFVMELVGGVPLTEFCHDNRLSARARLQLFIPVCQAVQHAHQKGIIHRDLKPSNILVTLSDGTPHPKVIDFGVAKAIHQRLTEETSFTHVGTIIGTPAYMSPEQAEMSGLDIDTRSDIYSLGVLLYELLTGTTPFPDKRLRSVAYREMQRIIVEEEPERPSTRLNKTRASLDATEHDPKARIRNPKSKIDSDLDWIVLKCLEKERNRRYETASELASDILRYLRTEPVAARSPSVGYRFHKLVRRHRTASAALAAVAISVFLGAGISTWALIRERTAREQAGQHLNSALQFVDRIFDGVAPEIRRIPGATKAREMLGEAGLTMLQELRANAAQSESLREALAKVSIYLSETQGNIGEASTTGSYEAALQRAREAVQLLSNTTPPGDLPSKHLKMLIHARALIAASLHSLGRYDEAALELAGSEPLLATLERSIQFRPWARTRRAANLADAGYFIALAGRPQEGLESLQKALNSDWAKAITPDSSEWDIEVFVNIYGEITFAYEFLNQFEAMTQAAEAGMRFQELLVQRFPGNVRHAGCMAGFRAIHGHGLMRAGRASEGLRELEHGRGEIEDLIRKDPANQFVRTWRAYVATTQARAFAAWSEDPSSSLVERRERLAKAEKHLSDAETITSGLKSKEAPTLLNAARAALTAARLKSERTEGDPPRPSSQ